MTFDNDFKERVRDRVDFPTLVGQSTQLKRSPSGRKSAPALCPFHNNHNTPAMAVYEDHATCFGACGRTWDLYGWIMQRDGVDFPQALRTAAGLAGMTMPDWTPEQQQRVERQARQADVLSIAMSYYSHRLVATRHAAGSAYRHAKQRGWTLRTIGRARLGYADNDQAALLAWLKQHNVSQRQAIEAGLLVEGDHGHYLRFRERLIFPFVRAGRTHFVTGRDLTSQANAKWLHLALDDGEHRPLYGRVAGTGPLVMVESPADALTLAQLGWDAVATLGVSLPEGTAGALRKHRPLWIMMDDDPAGRRGIHRLGQAVGPRACIAILPDGRDANATLQHHGPAEAKSAIQQTLGGAPTYIEYLAEAYHDASGQADQDTALDLFLSSVEQLEARDLALMRPRLVRLSGLESRTFNELVKTSRKEDSGFTPTLDGRYGVVGGVICLMSHQTPTPLSNFSAQIQRVIKLDDGEEVRTEYLLGGATAHGRRLATARVPSKEFLEMKWTDQHWGVDAVVAAGKQNQVATAIKLLSQGAPAESVYTHTGWREIAGQRVYLHCGGALGYRDPTADIQVDLGQDLGRYILPQQPVNPAEAFRASLRFLDVGQRAITLPLWAAMYQAPLGSILSHRMIIWLYGRTNTFKSTAVLLAMRHYGQFRVEGDVVNWISTANAIELLAFKIKDAPLVIDDFAHQPNHYDQRRMQQAAERIIRTTGNETGRKRMSSDVRMRRTYHIRALIISTGETLPSVAPSAHSRIIPLRLTPDAIDLERLTAAQAESDQYGHAMAGYLLWLRDNWDQIAQRLPDLHQKLRAKAGNQRTARLTDAITRNYLALRLATEYGQHVGALSEPDAAALRAEHWENLLRLAEAQDQEVKEEDPIKRFLNLLVELIQQNKAWLTAVGDEDDTQKPHYAEKIGWQDADHYWLIPEGAFGLIQRQASATGRPLAFSLREIQERLYESGALIKDTPPRWNSRLQSVAARPWLMKLDRQKILDLAG